VADGLSSIEGLADKHQRVLARHHVTDLRGLIQADRRVIHRAMANLRPRPTLELVSRWQDDARSMLDEAVTDTSDWHTAASFVVVFGQRQRNGAWERRVEVEQTEVEPERNPQLWPDWDCTPVCAWLASQLGQPSDPEPPRPADPEPLLPADPEPPRSADPESPRSAEAASPLPAATAPLGPASEPGPAPQPAVGRPSLRIDSATLIDAGGGSDVVKAGEPAADPRTELTAPVRVALTVSGAQPGTRLQAVARIQRPDAPGWNPCAPVVPSASGQAEFDLSPVPAGDHAMSLIAWAPDASAKPVSVRLPRITIHAPRDE
jgi:hypothetical protein